MTSEKSLIKRWGNQLLYTGPTTLIFVMVMIVPFLYGIYLTLFKWDGISSDMPFVGLTNYIGVFQDERFWQSVWITVKYVAATVTLINLCGFLLAYLIVTGLKRQNFVRAVFFSPSLIGGLVLGFLWQFLFNQFFVSIGQKYELAMFSKSWLGDPDKAFWAMVIVTVWHYAGYMMVIFIAGLMNVPKDLMEAGSIDGANKWRQLFHITLPLMVPSFIVTIFLSLQRGFMVYDLNYALTEGGPYGSTVLVSMHVFDKAFKSYDYGMGQAEAFVLFFIVATVTMLQLYFSKKKEVEI
jgi:raffinose/stachyose/melibiose transport system permease protein